MRVAGAILLCGLAACSAPWVTIGVVDDSPDLYAFLDDAGISHAEDGSVVYALLVPERDAARATRLLLEPRAGKSAGGFRTEAEWKPRSTP